MKFNSSMKDLKITLVQTSLSWEDPQANLSHLDELISGIRKNSTHLIMLPEMFTTGFTMNAAKVAHTMKGKEVSWMLNLAKQKNAVVCGSLVITAQGKYYNRLLWVQPDGKLQQYDKRHLFRMADEHKTFTPGKKKLMVTLQGWNICPLVCYDLRFPVWSRSKGDVDLMLFVANWPERRSYPWKQLLIARAIENQCFMFGVNRIGIDGNGLRYQKSSIAITPDGDLIEPVIPGHELDIYEIEPADAATYRSSFPTLRDKRYELYSELLRKY